MGPHSMAGIVAHGKSGLMEAAIDLFPSISCRVYTVTHNQWPEDLKIERQRAVDWTDILAISSRLLTVKPTQIHILPTF